MAGGASDFPGGLLAESLDPGAVLNRVHRSAVGPIWFGPGPDGPPMGRFDAPQGEFRVLYAAANLAGAFAESVLRRPGVRILRREFIAARTCSFLLVKGALTVAKLYDEGLAVHGLDAAQAATPDYKHTQALALAFHQAFPDLDGLAYRSRIDNGQICYALFDRAAPAALEATGGVDFAKLPQIAEELLRHYRVVIDTTPPLPDLDSL